MEDRTYNTLTCSEDSSDDHALTSNEVKQVSLSMGRPGAFMNHHKVLTVILSVLAVTLLTIDIGLAVYYRNLTDTEWNIKNINAKIAKLQNAYKNSIDAKIESKKELAKENILMQQTKWEIIHEKKKSADFQKESERLLTIITGLRSHMPLIKDGCRYCQPGWSLIQSVCYYIPLSENAPRRTWWESREYCKNFGADLIKINSREKQLLITNLINTYHNPLVQYAASGFWIGARDVDEEGVWKWQDGTQVNEGFWNIGEPNNQGNEDCAAVYPGPNKNPFNSWNDAPCSHHIKWICEKATN